MASFVIPNLPCCVLNARTQQLVACYSSRLHGQAVPLPQSSLIDKTRMHDPAFLQREHEVELIQAGACRLKREAWACKWCCEANVCTPYVVRHLGHFYRLREKPNTVELEHHLRGQQISSMEIQEPNWLWEGQSPAS